MSWNWHLPFIIHLGRTPWINMCRKNEIFIFWGAKVRGNTFLWSKMSGAAPSVLHFLIFFIELWGADKCNKGPLFNYINSILVAQPMWRNLNLSALSYSTGGKHCRTDLMFWNYETADISPLNSIGIVSLRCSADVEQSIYSPRV